LAVIGFLVAALVLLAPAFAMPPPSRDTLILGYWEAKAAGLPVGPTAAEMGLPECPKTPDPGFASVEEAEAAMARRPKPECRADPTTALFGFGPNVRLEAKSLLAVGIDRAAWAVQVGRVWTSIAAWRLAGSPQIASSWDFGP